MLVNSNSEAEYLEAFINESSISEESSENNTQLDDHSEWIDEDAHDDNVTIEEENRAATKEAGPTSSARKRLIVYCNSTQQYSIRLKAMESTVEER